MAEQRIWARQRKIELPPTPSGKQCLHLHYGPIYAKAHLAVLGYAAASSPAQVVVSERVLAARARAASAGDRLRSFDPSSDRRGRSMAQRSSGGDSASVRSSTPPPVRRRPLTPSQREAACRLCKPVKRLVLQHQQEAEGADDAPVAAVRSAAVAAMVEADMSACTFSPVINASGCRATSRHSSSTTCRRNVGNTAGSGRCHVSPGRLASARRGRSPRLARASGSSSTTTTATAKRAGSAPNLRRRCCSPRTTPPTTPHSVWRRQQQRQPRDRARLAAVRERIAELHQHAEQRAAVLAERREQLFWERCILSALCCCVCMAPICIWAGCRDAR